MRTASSEAVSAFALVTTVAASSQPERGLQTSARGGDAGIHVASERGTAVVGDENASDDAAFDEQPVQADLHRVRGPLLSAQEAHDDLLERAVLAGGVVVRVGGRTGGVLRARTARAQCELRLRHEVDLERRREERLAEQRPCDRWQSAGRLADRHPGYRSRRKRVTCDRATDD